MLDGKNYTVRVGWSLIYWTRHPNSNPYHIIYAISQVMSKLDLFSFYTHKNGKQRVSVNVYRFSFRSYADLTQMLAFFLDLFVYLFRCSMISLYWDVSCVWAQYIYLEYGKSTMPIEPCHAFARWGVTLISCGYLPIKPKTAPFPPRGGRGQGGEKDFIILSAFSLCNSFTGHCSYIHCFVGEFEKPVKWGLSGMNSFLKWTNLRKIAFGGLIKIFWLY